MIRKCLVVDDSALMRSIICDIIQSDTGYQVEDIAKNGQEAYELLKVKQYSVVVLDINMPLMTGLELLEVLQKEDISATVIMASTLTKDGAKETFRALELGAFDFVTKPDRISEARGAAFQEALKNALMAASKMSKSSTRVMMKPKAKFIKPVIRQDKSNLSKVVALACSTGGPKSLQSVIPYLPHNLDAAVLLVQHMPAGFTATLAERLDSISKVKVKEAEHGEVVKKGYVYIAPGGKHLMCAKTTMGHKIRITDDPPVKSLKPCANIMYESLVDCSYDRITCVVLTGMGDDGTNGIKKLKTKKDIYVIAQDAKTSIVYGMPKSIKDVGLADEMVALHEVSEAITRKVGVY